MLGGGGCGSYCIDNGAMIAYTGLLMHRHGHTTPLAEATCTQVKHLPFG